MKKLFIEPWVTSPKCCWT